MWSSHSVAPQFSVLHPAREDVGIPVVVLVSMWCEVGSVCAQGKSHRSDRTCRQPSPATKPICALSRHFMQTQREIRRLWVMAMIMLQVGRWAMVLTHGTPIALLEWKQ